MLVGIVGFIGSGKGTAGEILTQWDFNKESFAGPVKDTTSIMFGWPRSLLEGDTDESREFRERPDKFWSAKFGRPFTPREALQKMGTEAGRNVFHQNFWIDRLEHKILPDENYVITDTRFENEMKWIKSRGGVIIEINRGPQPHWYEIAEKANHGYAKATAYMMKEVGVHESEWRWIDRDLIDATIENSGTKKDLEINLTKELTKFFGQAMMSEIANGEINATV